MAYTVPDTAAARGEFAAVTNVVFGATGSTLEIVNTSVCDVNASNFKDGGATLQLGQAGIHSTNTTGNSAVVTNTVRGLVQTFSSEADIWTSARNTATCAFIRRPSTDGANDVDFWPRLRLDAAS